MPEYITKKREPLLIHLTCLSAWCSRVLGSPETICLSFIFSVLSRPEKFFCLALVSPTPRADTRPGIDTHLIHTLDISMSARDSHSGSFAGVYPPTTNMFRSKAGIKTPVEGGERTRNSTPPVDLEGSSWLIDSMRSATLCYGKSGFPRSFV